MATKKFKIFSNTDQIRQDQATKQFISASGTERKAVHENRSAQIQIRLTPGLKNRMDLCQRSTRGIDSINELINIAIEDGLSDPELIPENDPERETKSSRIRLLTTQTLKRRMENYMKYGKAKNRNEFIIASIQNYLSKNGY